MTSFRVRPKFKLSSDKSIEEIILLLNRSFENTALPIEGRIFKTHGLIRIKPVEQHYWSPQLSISFEENEDNKTIIRGMYGPHPSVWAVFLMGYVLLGIGIFFLSMIGLVKMSLKHDSALLWIVPFLIGGMIILWFLAQAGQKIGAEQTFIIHHFIEESISESIHINMVL